jgi:hypothetical protein
MVLMHFVYVAKEKKEYYEKILAISSNTFEHLIEEQKHTKSNQS